MGKERTQTKKSADEPSSYWCSVPGCTADGRKKANLAAYPWMKGVTFHAYQGLHRNPSLRRRVSLYFMMEVLCILLQILELHTDHEYSIAHRKYPEYSNAEVHTDLSVHDINIMETESASYSKGNVLRELFVHKATNSDASVRRYFGLPSISILLGLFSILENASKKLKYWSGKDSIDEKRYEEDNARKPGPERKLTMFHEYLLTLLRIRQDLNIGILKDIFGISESRVSKIFNTWINYMYRVFSPQIKWPSMQKIRKYMPRSFKASFPNTRVIIDCTEVFIQKPRSPTAQSQTYSNYKNHSTFKALVGITPSGAFSFISKF
ncbi:uncharacterized protein LOC134256656 [Saccostrea cucullata]|uniref:uncharacterized protein LOC134256656 n=1 Tax=Saccostrea cuccullata TaxID=36930 RepID=UPI002ED0F99D